MAGNQMPVIEVPVNTDGPKQLLALIEKIQTAAKSLPKGLAGISPLSTMGSGTGIANPDPKKFKEINKEAERFNKFGTQINKTFSKTNTILGKTKSILGDIVKFSLTSFSLINLAATGGILGMDAMARRANAKFMTAQGMGMSLGQMQAAHNVYGTRFSGLDGTMQGLASAQNDISNPAYAGLMSLGIDPSKSAGDNLPALFQGVYGLLKSKGIRDAGLAMPLLKAMRLDGLFNNGEINQILASGDKGQLSKLAATYSAESRALNISGGVQGNYQNTVARLAYDGDLIANSFLKALAPLNGPITKMADGFTKSISEFLNGSNGKAVFKLLSDGLNKLASWLNAPSFQNDLKTFADVMSGIVKGLYEALKWLKLIPGATSTSKTNNIPNTNPITGKPSYFFPGPSHKWGAYQMPQAQQAALVPLYKQWSKENNLPDGLMGAIAHQESGGNPYALSPVGARGLFQFMYKTGRYYGLKNSVDFYDPVKNSVAGAHYLGDLSRRYHGDIAKMLAQYNGGNSAVRGDTLYANLETVNYLRSILPKVRGAEDQHPGLMARLDAAQERLQNNPKEHLRIQLDVKQNPGADYSASIKAQSPFKGPLIGGY